MSDINTLPGRLAEEEAAKRAEELKPVKEKLTDFAAKVQFLTLPEGLSEDVCDSVNHLLLVAADGVRKIAKGLK